MYATLDQLKAVIPARDLELLTDFERDGDASDERLVEALEDATARSTAISARWSRFRWWSRRDC